jgi:hypothetical protein
MYLDRIKYLKHCRSSGDIKLKNKVMTSYSILP